MEKMKVRAIDVQNMRLPILLHVLLLAALAAAHRLRRWWRRGCRRRPRLPATPAGQRHAAGARQPPRPPATPLTSISPRASTRATRARRRDSPSKRVPPNVMGTLSTRHLKNTDLATGPQAISPVYEICTNDMAQAIDWSEKQATWQGQYSDMVEVHGDNRMFEIVRVPRADVTAMIRHRVFRCDYLDRAGSDLRADAGSAGSMNQRPLTADELKSLAEYLWQFTMFNNSDYAVVSSTQFGERRFDRARPSAWASWCAAAAGGCDTVQVSDWTHTMNATDGTLTRALTACVRSR